ncbi:MAG TPA: tetratricopeptide repeat protein [Chthoniobacterales bacterium]
MEADVFERQVNEAQNASRAGDWPRALAGYVDLAEQFPNRTEPTRRLENLLSEVRNNPSRINPAAFATARPNLERAARLGVVQAMLILGQNLRSANSEDALAWYTLAAQKGNLEAMVQTGLIYSNRRDAEEGGKALEYFLRAAEGGSREGKYYTGECYYFGKPGVLPDEPKALQYLQEAAALGDLRAMNLLGDHLRKQSRYDEAFRYFEEAAKGGLAMATANLGVMYMNGWGVSKNREAAVNLFRQAAEKSDAGGMFFLAECLQGGLGTAKDPRAALDWFKKAARAGNPKAIEYCRANAIDLP